MNSLVTTTSSAAVLGTVLVISRNIQGLKQADVAAALGLTASALSRIEKGENNLSVDQLRMIAKALNVSPVKLLEITEIAEQYLAGMGIKICPLGTSLTTLKAMQSVLPVIGFALSTVVSTVIETKIRAALEACVLKAVTSLNVLDNNEEVAAGASASAVVGVSVASAK